MPIAEAVLEPSSDVDPEASSTAEGQLRTEIRPGEAGRELCGETLGAYEVLDLIAVGGMGSVYRAKQTSMGRLVALKVLAPRLASKPTYVKRFLREARAAAALEHPNIVRIYDIGEGGGYFFYSMELVTGRSLSRAMRGTGGVGPRRAIEVGIACAKALVFAETRGIVHRDIKPPNILLGDDGSIQLADMGLAKFTDGDAADSGSLTTAGSLIGSPNYMPPERVRDPQRADAMGDIYSLGATLYHAVSGELPFGGGAPMEILQRVLHGDLLGADDPARERIPEPLRSVIARMASHERADRFQTPAEMLAALEAIQNAALTPTRTPLGHPSTPRGSSAARRRSGRGPARSSRRLQSARPRRRPSASPAPTGGSRAPLGVVAALTLAALVGLVVLSALRPGATPETSPGTTGELARTSGARSAAGETVPSRGSVAEALAARDDAAVTPATTTPPSAASSEPAPAVGAPGDVEGAATDDEEIDAWLDELNAKVAEKRAAARADGSDDAAARSGAAPEVAPQPEPAGPEPVVEAPEPEVGPSPMPEPGPVDPAVDPAVDPEPAPEPGAAEPADPAEAAAAAAEAAVEKLIDALAASHVKRLEDGRVEIGYDWKDADQREDWRIVRPEDINDAGIRTLTDRKKPPRPWKEAWDARNGALVGQGWERLVWKHQLAAGEPIEIELIARTIDGSAAVVTLFDGPGRDPVVFGAGFALRPLTGGRWGRFGPYADWFEEKQETTSRYRQPQHVILREESFLRFDELAGGRARPKGAYKIFVKAEPGADGASTELFFSPEGKKKGRGLKATLDEPLAVGAVGLGAFNRTVFYEEIRIRGRLAAPAR